MEQIKPQDEWIVTHTSKFFLHGESHEDVKLDDIAHALSHLCRYNGHCPNFYSVAEHSSMVAEVIFEHKKDPKLAMCGLLHDASEAYIGDMVRPLKRSFPEFKEMEEKVMTRIIKAFDLYQTFISEEAQYWVKKADNIMLATEGEKFFGDTSGWYLPEEADHRFAPECVDPWMAKAMFLHTYNDFEYTIRTSVQK